MRTAEHGSVDSFAIHSRVESSSLKHSAHDIAMETGISGHGKQHRLEMLNNERIICRTRLFCLPRQSIIHRVSALFKAKYDTLQDNNLLEGRGETVHWRLLEPVHAYFVACNYTIHRRVEDEMFLNEEAWSGADVQRTKGRISASRFALRVLLAIHFKLEMDWWCHDTPSLGVNIRIEFACTECQEDAPSLAHQHEQMDGPQPHIVSGTLSMRFLGVFFLCGNQSWQPGLKSMLL